jgi:hypothetical protein
MQRYNITLITSTGMPTPRPTSSPTSRVFFDLPWLSTARVVLEVVVLDPELDVEAEVPIVPLVVDVKSELCQTRRTPNPMLHIGVCISGVVKIVHT